MALANTHLATDNTRVIHPEHSIHIVHALRAHVREFLDLGCRILDLIIVQLELELLNTGLDRVPAC